jgi:inhibitor of KinA sporulation pathway (predicted exonuclease)
VISQEQVDAGASFEATLKIYDDWMRKMGLINEDGTDAKKFAFVVCGDWDLGSVFSNRFGFPRLSSDTFPAPMVSTECRQDVTDADKERRPRVCILLQTRLGQREESFPGLL